MCDYSRYMRIKRKNVMRREGSEIRSKSRGYGDQHIMRKTLSQRNLDEASSHIRPFRWSAAHPDCDCAGAGSGGDVGRNSAAEHADVWPNLQREQSAGREAPDFVYVESRRRLGHLPDVAQ